MSSSNKKATSPAASMSDEPVERVSRSSGNPPDGRRRRPAPRREIHLRRRGLSARVGLHEQNLSMRLMRRHGRARLRDDERLQAQVHPGLPGFEQVDLPQVNVKRRRRIHRQVPAGLPPARPPDRADWFACRRPCRYPAAQSQSPSPAPGPTHFRRGSAHRRQVKMLRPDAQNDGLADPHSEPVQDGPTQVRKGKRKPISGGVNSPRPAFFENQLAVRPPGSCRRKSSSAASR